MNATPPCPNATPAPEPWMAQAAVECWESLLIDCGTSEENLECIDGLMALIQRHAPTAPRPTTDGASSPGELLCPKAFPPTPVSELVEQLAAAKLDAEALAGALDNLMRESKLPWAPGEHALAAHRARVAAGGKQ